MIAIWDTVLCSLVEADRRLRGAYCLYHQGDEMMMEAVCTSETSVCVNETTQHCIPEGYHLHTRRRENLKSHDLLTLFMLLLRPAF
jgi:hypothetical protein